LEGTAISEERISLSATSVKDRVEELKILNKCSFQVLNIHLVEGILDLIFFDKNGEGDCVRLHLDDLFFFLLRFY
jgi:hypothetical protein